MSGAGWGELDKGMSLKVGRWMIFPWGYDYLWSSELQHGVDIFRCICHRPWFKPTQHLAPRSPKQASLKPREATYYRDTIWCVFDAKYWGIQLRSSNIDHLTSTLPFWGAPHVFHRENWWQSSSHWASGEDSFQRCPCGVSVVAQTWPVVALRAKEDRLRRCLFQVTMCYHLNCACIFLSWLYLTYVHYGVSMFALDPVQELDDKNLHMYPNVSTQREREKHVCTHTHIYIYIYINAEISQWRISELG